MNKTKRFNSLDVLIILFILVIISMTVVKLYVGEKALDKELTEYEINFYAEDIKPTIKNGAEVIYNDVQIGTIVGDPHNEYVYYVDGIQVLDRANVSGSISVMGKSTSKGFLLNGKTFLAKGKKMELIIGKHLVRVTITSIVNMEKM